MKLTTRLLTLGTLVLLLGACSSGDISETDSGGVLLSISDFDGLPSFVDVSASGGVATIGTITVQNIAKNPSTGTSSLMNVEVQSYRVHLHPRRRGTRVPPKLIEYDFGVVPVERHVRLRQPALPEAGPVRSAAPQGSGRLRSRHGDEHTVVRMRVTLRVFGRTLSGDAVASTPASFTVDVVP